MTDAPEIVLYTRPGCPFSLVLKARMTAARMTWTERDIWEDPSAAAAVRAVANGNETVPTVNVGDVWMVNPSLGEVRKALRGRDASDHRMV
jgi:mycoredoxin